MRVRFFEGRPLTCEYITTVDLDQSTIPRKGELVSLSTGNPYSSIPDINNYIVTKVCWYYERYDENDQSRITEAEIYLRPYNMELEE